MNSHGIWTTRLVLAGISNAQMDSLASTLRSDRLQVDVLHVDLADECSIAALVEKSNEAERVLALETVPHGVRINLISPGPTESEMMRKLIADHPNMANLADGNLESFRPPIPDAHVGQPDQVAAAAAFLLSPDSSHISFHDLYLDGGETLGI